VTAVTGRHGQANYASGNSYLDTLARYLTSSGRREKVIALDLGVFKSVGHVATQPDVVDKLLRDGFVPTEEKDLVRILEYYCDPAVKITKEEESQLITGIDTPANLQSRGLDIPSWMADSPIFLHLFQFRQGGSAASGDGSSDGEKSFSQRIVSMTSVSEIGVEIADELASKLARTLAVDRKDIDTNKPVHGYGVDSLAAVEVRSWMKRVLGCDVAVFEILGNASILELGMNLVQRCEFLKDSFDGLAK